MADALESGLTDAEVEGVARLMCEKMGLDPDRQVDGCSFAAMTPWESRYGVTPIKYQPPITGAPPYLDANTTYQRNFRPRWTTFRRDAALALASWRAVHHYMLAIA